MPLPLIPIALGAAAGIVGSKIVDAVRSRYVYVSPHKVGRRVVNLEEYLFEDSCGNYCEFGDMDEDDQENTLSAIARGDYDL